MRRNGINKALTGDILVEVYLWRVRPKVKLVELDLAAEFAGEDGARAWDNPPAQPYEHSVVVARLRPLHRHCATRGWILFLLSLTNNL